MQFWTKVQMKPCSWREKDEVMCINSSTVHRLPCPQIFECIFEVVPTRLMTTSMSACVRVACPARCRRRCDSPGRWQTNTAAARLDAERGTSCTYLAATQQGKWHGTNSGGFVSALQDFFLPHCCWTPQASFCESCCWVTACDDESF